MLSVKQRGIKYHFLSLWYDSTWDRTQVSQAIGEHSNHYANVQFKLYKHSDYLKTSNVCVQVDHLGCQQEMCGHWEIIYTWAPTSQSVSHRDTESQPASAQRRAVPPPLGQEAKEALSGALNMEAQHGKEERVNIGVLQVRHQFVSASSVSLCISLTHLISDPFEK